MENINVNIQQRVSSVTAKDNIMFINVEESEEVIIERNFQKRLKKEVTEQSAIAIAAALEAIEPDRQSEKEEEFNKGRSIGHQQGYDEAMEMIVPLRTEVGNIIREVLEYKDQIFREAEKTLVHMAFEFSKNIIRIEIKQNPDIVKAQVKNALKYVTSEGRLTFKINPEDILSFDQKEEFIPEEFLERVHFVPDETVDRGGCKLLTNTGTIDSIIESQISELKDDIFEGLASDSIEETESDSE